MLHHDTELEVHRRPRAWLAQQPDGGVEAFGDELEHLRTIMDVVDDALGGGWRSASLSRR